jgi:hypothetical protein
VRYQMVSVSEGFLISDKLQMGLSTVLQMNHLFLVRNGFFIEKFPLCFNSIFLVERYTY